VNSLSVIIPTYNRCATLQKVLSAFFQQSALSSISEIIVVDDGSTDSTREVVDRLAQGSSVPIRYFRQENKGPGAARNLGIREVASELILFTDDDIIPQPALVAEHLDWHRKSPESSAAVLGHVTWDPAVNATPFMKWYESHVFRWAAVAGLEQVGYEYFYTCNLSLKTEFLRRNGTFDEDFKTAAYEDTELAYRLNKAGMRLLYNPRASAYHHQFFRFSDVCRKAVANMSVAQLFLEKEAGQAVLGPQIEKKSGWWPRIARPMATVFAAVLMPARPLLNSRVPLPPFIYQLFYWHDVVRPADVLRP
jgi:glycosyltransferase involved in cell wall biosynthesis